MIKDVCEPCSRSINIGKPLLECENCNNAIHTKCFKTAKYSCQNGLWMCCECTSSAEKWYCLFPSDEESIDSDRFYENRNQEDALIVLQERCRRYSKIEFLNAVKWSSIPQKKSIYQLYSTI